MYHVFNYLPPQMFTYMQNIALKEPICVANCFFLGKSISSFLHESSRQIKRAFEQVALEVELGVARIQKGRGTHIG